MEKRSKKRKHTDSSLAPKIADVLYAAAGTELPRRYTSAIIAAAGQSTRMGGKTSKQFLTLCGMPVLAHTLLAYERARSIHEIIVVGREQDFPLIRELAERYGIRKLKGLVKGGSTRQESVLCGLKQVCPKTRYVAIADGARCLTTPEQIEAVCRKAYATRAATAATKVNDTVKQADAHGRIASTIDRSTVWLAQTPQVFDFNLYHAAAYWALEHKYEATDDNSVVEFINHPITLVDCGRENIKVTEPFDLVVAEAVIRRRAQKKAETEEDT